MNQVRLAYPWLLVAGLVALGLVAWWRNRRRSEVALTFSSDLLMRDLPVSWAQQVKPWLPWLRALGMFLLVIAWARPQQGLREFRVQTEGIAIAMCIDRSGSMQAMDFFLEGRRVDRLAAVKRVFLDFMLGDDNLPGRTNDLIALIVFGGFAEARSPLTLDHEAVAEVLEDVRVSRPLRDDDGRVVEPEMAEQELATAIGDAVALAVDRLRDCQAKSKIVILLSDGENTAGELTPEDGAAAAKALGVKVYTIGVGRTGRAPFPGIDAFGRRTLVAQNVRLDEATLKMLADTTGGQYFHAEDTDNLTRVYQEIDKLEKTKSEGRLYTEYREWYAWFLVPGLALILLDAGLQATRFRSAP